MAMDSAMGKVRRAMGRHGRGLGGATVQVGRLGFTEACSARVAGVTVRELGFLFTGLELTGNGP